MLHLHSSTFGYDQASGIGYIQSMSDPFDLGAFPPVPTQPDAPQSAYLARLNPAQRAAVEALEGPVLVLAGAGTGKTRVLTTRLTHILNQRLAYPSQILAVTFTNRAAREMRERVAEMIGDEIEGLWLGTFHAIAARMLRRHAEMVGLKSNFTILDTDDQLRLLKQLLQAESIDEKEWPPRALAAIIDRWKDKGLTPDRISRTEAGGFADGKAGDLYRQYQLRLRSLNACDFGDLILHLLTIFLGNADVLANWQKRFRFVLVDEYQDTNVAQYLWMRLLARQSRNICCVGDDDQSIYAWRGAEVGNILRFEQDFEGARIVRLEQNYRSTPHILGTAAGLIAHNEGRLGKTLWTEINEGEKVGVRGVWDGAEEARLIGDDIEALQRSKHQLSDIAILVRAGFQTREFEERFLKLGLPYRVIGGARFYERAEIRDALAYLRVVAQPEDDLAFERIINVPKRGLGDSALQTLRKTAADRQSALFAAAEYLVTTDSLKPKPRTALRGLVEHFTRWRHMQNALPHAELTETILEESGYEAMLQAYRSPEAPGRLENLKELVRAMESFETLGEFLEHVALVMDRLGNENEDMVNLMTLHAAKGLEFDTVFLPGWEEGLFPHPRALAETGRAGLEEERRLAYVGITRARKLCHISYAANRRIYHQWQSTIPSRFVEELPDAHIERVTESGLWNGSSVNPHHAEISNDLTVGQRIFHTKFGYGRITEIDGDKLGITFDQTGQKKVLRSFVNPA